METSVDVPPVPSGEASEHLPGREGSLVPKRVGDLREYQALRKAPFCLLFTMADQSNLWLDRNRRDPWLLEQRLLPLELGGALLGIAVTVLALGPAVEKVSLSEVE